MYIFNRKYAQNYNTILYADWGLVRDKLRASAVSVHPRAWISAISPIMQRPHTGVWTRPQQEHEDGVGGEEIGVDRERNRRYNKARRYYNWAIIRGKSKNMILNINQQMKYPILLKANCQDILFSCRSHPNCVHSHASSPFTATRALPDIVFFCTCLCTCICSVRTLYAHRSPSVR